jgi:hypothetical protein
MFFFILHEFVPTYKNDYGSRNCRVFIYGIVLYCLCYLLLVNLLLYDKMPKLLYDALFWIGFIFILSDIAVISYKYKAFFGRTIVNEAVELNDDNNEKNWTYDELTHKYTRKEYSNNKSSKSSKSNKSSKSKKYKKI